MDRNNQFLVRNVGGGVCGDGRWWGDEEGRQEVGVGRRWGEVSLGFGWVR